MDPDAALAAIHEAIDDLHADGIDGDAVTALIDHFQALDAWLAGGGFLPAAWHPTRVLRP